MKALTIHQPWATFLLSGRKRVETRPWAPPVAMYGERFAIHAGAESGSVVQAQILAFFPEGARAQVVSRTGPPHSAILVYPPDPFGLPWVFPIGCVIATARLVRAVQVSRIDRVVVPEGRPELRLAVGREPGKRVKWRSYVVDAYGDFGVGRWLFELDRLEAVRPPVPARGQQKFWNWNPEAEERNGNRL